MPLEFSRKRKKKQKKKIVDSVFTSEKLVSEIRRFYRDTRRSRVRKWHCAMSRKSVLVQNIIPRLFSCGVSIFSYAAVGKMAAFRNSVHYSFSSLGNFDRVKRGEKIEREIRREIYINDRIRNLEPWHVRSRDLSTLFQPDRTHDVLFSWLLLFFLFSKNFTSWSLSIE